MMLGACVLMFVAGFLASHIRRWEAFVVLFLAYAAGAILGAQLH